MSAPVDVLAVLDRLEARAERNRWAIAVRDDIESIRAAVAGLIERDKTQREALETCQRWFAAYSPTAPLITGGSAEHPMVTMLNAALARVGGSA